MKNKWTVFAALLLLLPGWAGAVINSSFVIGIGQAVSDGVPAAGAGRIESAGAEDVYTFTNAGGQTVFFDSFGRSGGTIFWQVVDASGRELFEWDFNAGDPGQFTLPVSGTNRVRASGPGGSTGTYGFQVWAVPAAQSFAIALGQPVSDGVPVSGAGRIESPGAVDLFTFTATPGQTLFFDSFGRSGGAIYWQVTDALGNQLFDWDFNSGNPGSFTVPAGGVHQIRVYGPGASVGTYGFQVWGVPPPDEFAIALDEPVVLDVPEWGAGFLETPGAEDLYTFTNAPGQVVCFDVLANLSNARWRMVDALGNELFDQYFSSGTPGFFLLSAGGTNRLRVYGVGDTVGTYGLMVWSVPSAQSFAIAIDQPVALDVPAAGAGDLETPGAVDFYTFTNSPGQIVFFDSFGSTPAYALRWQALDATGHPLFDTRLNDADPGSFTLAAGGTNQVRVYSLNEAVGTYAFRVRTMPAAQRFTVAVDLPVLADVPAPGAGRIETPGAVDLYAFTNTPGLSAYFDSFGSTPAFALRWQALDAAGNLMFDTRLNDADPGLFTLVTGTNYVRVSGLGDAVGTYSFRVRPVPAAQSFIITVDQPVRIDQPATGAGRIETAGAVDFYRFTNGAGQTVFFKSFGASSPVNWQVWDSNGKELFNRTFNSGDPGKWHFPVPGTNRIRVYGPGDLTGTYGFQLVNTNASGSTTNQPLPADRFTIAIGDTVTNDVPAAGAGNLEVPGARDLYFFTAAAGTSVYFEDLGAAVCCLDWAVYDELGNTVFGDRLDGTDPGRYLLSRGGAYTVVAQAAGANPNSTGPYSFRLRSLPPDQTFAIAIGDTVTNGIPSAGAGNLEAPGARDIYTFIAPPGAQVYFEDLGSAAFYLRWTLDDPTGARLFDDRLDGNDPGRITLNLGGTYTITAFPEGALPDRIGPYAFRLRAVPPDQRFFVSIGDTVTNGLPAPGAGNLESPGAQDSYTFTAAAGTQVYFEDFGSASFYLRWALDDPRGTRLFDDRLDGNDPGRFTLNLSGTFTITVFPEGAVADRIGPYSFALRPVPADQNFTIAIGASVTDGLPAPGAGNLEEPGARDIYTFTATAGTQVYFEDLGSDAVYLRWTVDDAKGTRLFDDRLDGTDPGRFTLNLGGIYTITVFPEGAVADRIGPYSFRLRPVPADQSFTIALGDTVTDGQPAPGAGNLEKPGARDIYTFTATAGTQVYFEDLGSDAVYLRWTVDDANGTRLFDDRLDGTDPGRYSLNLGGTYTIAVSPEGALPDRLGPYSFRLGAVPPDQTFAIAIGDAVSDGIPAPGAGNLEVPGARDLYTFTATAGMQIYFEDAGSAATFLRWAVEAPNGTGLFDDRLDGTDPGRYTLSSGGTYTIIVSPEGSLPDRIGAYSFRIWGPLPYILAQPQSARGLIGQNHTFSLTAASPFTPLRYQWRVNGSNIASATNSLLFLNSPAPGNAGSYEVVVSNPNGSVTSHVATLTLDASEFFVSGFAPSGLGNSNVNELFVQFSQPILASSFTSADITVRGPAGALNSASFVITSIDPRTFRVNVPAQSLDGAYTVEIGPTITNLSGQPMAGDIFVPVYSTDFETGSGPEWDRPDTSFSAISTRFLGQFGNEMAALSLANLPPHQRLRLVWDLAILDTWDGNAGPDYFGLNIDGAAPPAWEYTFHASGNPALQSYPFAPVVAGTNFFGGASVDSIHRNLSFDFAHTNGDLVLSFYGRGLQAITDESWGIDNVRVFAALPSNGLFSARFTIDQAPPAIASLVPGTNGPPVSWVEVTFSEPIQPATFTSADVQFTGPLGPVALNEPQRLSPSSYRLTFPSQYADGAYRVVIGPGVLDLAGNSMTDPATNLFAIGRAPVSIAISGPRLLNEEAAINGLWFGAWNPLVSGADAGSLQYQWTFGDGTTNALLLTTHGYQAPGLYHLAVTAYDHGVPLAAAAQEVAVLAGAPPVARIVGTNFTGEGAQPLALSGLTSTDDGGILSYRWLLTPQRFEFPGRFIDPNQWGVANARQDERLIVTGQGVWGSAWFYSASMRLRRGGSLEGRVDTASGTSHAMIGLRDLSVTAGSYDRLVYGLYFADGVVQIYEKGSPRGTATNYSRGASYDFRIETKPDSGARYYLRPSGTGASFVKAFETTNYSENAFGFGAHVHSGVWGFDDLMVDAAYVEGSTVTIPSFPAGTVSLEVVDHALQTNVVSVVVTSVTGTPPVAVINGPATGPAGVEIPFSASGSSDDYAIGSYTWDFGDGSSPSFGPAVSHRFGTPGAYAVTLTVSDHARQAATQSLVITITGSNAVVSVPWRIINGIVLPHETWSGKEISLKAVARGVPTPFTYIWDFGDGSGGVTNIATDSNAAYALEARHAFAASDDTPFYATIRIAQTNGVILSDSYPILVRPKTLDVEMNVAIDEGLWWLHKQQARYPIDASSQVGDWTDRGYKINATASAVQAFAVNGHVLTGDSIEDPYVDTVLRGVGFLLTALTPLPIGPQPYGDPDRNHNNIGLSASGNRPIYETGPIMDALVAAASPELLAPVGGPNVKGRALRDIMQDMVDTYCWGQGDDPTVGGGWRYGWNENPDNSASQWGAIGLAAAERYWDIPVPSWAKERNLVWLNYSSGFGYTGGGDGEATTPSGLVQLAFNGVTTNHPLWQLAESRVAGPWNTTMTGNNIYAHYAIAKAFRLMLPYPVQKLTTGKDWFLDPSNGLARTTIDRQRTDGSWLAASSGISVEAPLSTAWSTLILSSSFFQRGPVAVVRVRPNPASIGYPVVFDGRDSYHQHPSYRVAEWRWDFDSSDGVDFDHPDALGPLVTNYFGRIGTNTVSLQVRDNGAAQLNDSDSVEVSIGVPPFAPTADAAGPYVAAVREDVHLDGSGSFDVDAALGDYIRAWDWEIDFVQPLDFDDGVTGARAVIAGGFATAGPQQIGLRVTDATSLVFPTSGRPDLTHDAFTRVSVYDRVITNLLVRAKQAKCQLVWTKVGDYAVIVRSRLGPNHGFQEIGRTDSAYASFLDTNVEYNIEYFYRVYAWANGQSEPLGISDAQHAVSHPLGGGDRAPYFVASPPHSATVGRLYEIALQARDPENDPYVFNLLASPSGMTLDRTNGLVRFVPGLSQVGGHPVSFEVTNSGGRDVLSYELVVFPLSNSPPLVFANGPYSGAAGQSIQFSSAGTRDSDGDPLSYVWAFGDGASSTNLNPTHIYSAAGNYAVSLFANDGRGGTTPVFTQATISRANRIPVARAGGNQTTLVARSVRLDGSASYDLDPGPLYYQWSFVSRPPGSVATLEASTSSRPTFTADQPGTYVVQLIVSDGQANSAPDAVFITTANSTPVANAGPDQRVLQGQTAQLDGTRSSDFDHNPLTYRWTLLTRPAGSAAVLANANTAQPTFGVDMDGGYEVQLIVSDGQLDSAPDTVFITTRNFPPVITSTPPTNAIPNSLWRYQLTAFDPYDTNLTFSLGTHPAGMTLVNPQASTLNSQLTWTPTLAQLGDHPVTVTVTDSEGASTNQSFVVHVGADTDPPQVVIRLVLGEVSSAGQWAARLGSTATFEVSARDNADGPLNPSSFTLNVGSQIIALNGAGQGSTVASNAGLYNVVATATDSAGNHGTTNSAILFYDPNATNTIFVNILSPTNGATVTKPVPIVATLSNATDLLSYRVDFARAADVDLGNIAVEGPQFTVLTNVTLPPGTRRLTNSVLARFDPTLLLNDDYVLRVVASDGRSLWYEPVVVSVAGELKFGELRLDFTDLSVPLVGIPITVSRVYDSREANRQGDFGHGWRLGLRDADIRKTLRQGGMYLGSRVFLNTPDGRRVGFTTKVDSSAAFGFVFLFIGFDADPGVYEKLAIEGDNVAIYYSGQLHSGFIDPFNPTRFRLTARDGTVYTYDEHAGLQEIRDLNTNVVTFATNGIYHSSGAHIEFVRDILGRIGQIIDPAGNALTYVYDARGDLRSFSDQVTNVTQYLYHAQRAHYLTNIIDALGHQALRMEYDAAGRLVSITDANGNPIRQDFDADSKIATYRDANGNTNIIRYDDNGNSVMKSIPGVSTNYFSYDANNNLLAATNGRGYATNYTYDAVGNLTSIQDALSNRTLIAYNEFQKPVRVTNALGQTITLRYDTTGKLLEVANSLGLRTTVTRDTAGRVTGITDAEGNTTRFDYEAGCACGKPGKVINPDGSFRLYEYDSQGRTNRIVNELGAETLFQRDDSGRLVWIRDPLMNFTYFQYHGPLLTNVVDALGRSTRYEYDALNRTNRIIDAQGGIVEFRYDGNGNRTRVIDPVTNVTVFSYDQANRLKYQVDPLSHTNFFSYDAAGNRIEALDRNGRRRTFAYDALNRMTNEIWWEGTNVVRSIVFGFNALGVQVLAADPTARYDFSYDALNRLERVTQSAVSGQPDFSLAYTYTVLGQVESVTDNWGVRVGSTYDSRNRLARRTWLGPGVDPARVDFAYDAAGNRTRIDRYADLAAGIRVGFTTNAYNRAGLVTNITHLGPASEVLAKYEYNLDAAYQITRWAIGNQLSDFAYDRTGQLTNAVINAQPNESFRYDPNGNRRGTQSSGAYVVGGNNQILSDGTNSYAYDAEGNMIARSNAVTGVLTIYQFDHRNRLVSVMDRSLGGVVTQAVAFAYDVMNRRLSKTVNGQVTRFLHHQDDSWADLDGSGAVTARYLLGNKLDELLARYRTGEGGSWYLSDHLGTVRDITSAQGSLLAHVQYGPFGQVLNIDNPAASDRFLFVGREFDSESGLYYVRTRYFAASLGRFINLDSLGFESGDANLYRYVGNNPLSDNDPLGQSEFIEYAILTCESFHAISFGHAAGHASAGVFMALADFFNGAPIDAEAVVEHLLEALRNLFIDAIVPCGAAGPFL